MGKLTPREELEDWIGQPILDETWSGIKDWINRNFQPDRTSGVVGYYVNGKVYHPSSVKIILSDGL